MTLYYCLTALLHDREIHYIQCYRNMPDKYRLMLVAQQRFRHSEFKPYLYCSIGRHKPGVQLSAVPKANMVPVQDV